MGAFNLLIDNGIDGFQNRHAQAVPGYLNPGMGELVLAIRKPRDPMR